MSDALLRNSIGSNLSSIQSLCRNLEDEAQHRFADSEMPGGEALVMLGPVANLEAFNYLKLSQIMGRTEGDRGLDDVKGDPAPPLLILADWGDRVAREKGDNRTEKATIEREIAYLRSVIDWIVGTNSDGEPYFIDAGELDSQLAAVVKRLEAVMKEGTRITYGAPCLHCVGVNMVRVEDAKYGLQDKFICPTCRRDYTKASYDYVVSISHLHHATELTAVQIETRTGIKASRVRVWGARYEGLKTKRSPEGLWLYSVQAVTDKRDELAA